MRILKRLPIVCAIVFCASVFPVHADDTPAQAAARAALMKALNGEPSQASTNAPTPPVAAPEQPAAAPPANVASPTNETSQLEVTNEIQPAVTNEIAQPAVTNEETAQPAQPEIAATNAPAQTNLTQSAPEFPPTVTPSIFPGKNPGFQPIQPPPLPISAEKQAQLQALLEQYKANQITPAQYQAQRAKILADP